MKRYIDVDALIKDLKSIDIIVPRGGCSGGKTWFLELIKEYSKIIDRQSIVEDIVSKEEYDKLKAEYDALEKDNKTVKDDAVKEVARRIKTYYASPRYDRPQAHTYLGVLMRLVNTITKDMTGDVVLDYAELSPKRLTPDDVRQMTREEVRQNLEVLLDSMDDWEGIV